MKLDFLVFLIGSRSFLKAFHWSLGIPLQMNLSRLASFLVLQDRIRVFQLVRMFGFFFGFSLDSDSKVFQLVRIHGFFDGLSFLTGIWIKNGSKKFGS